MKYQTFRFHSDLCYLRESAAQSFVLRVRVVVLMTAPRGGYRQTEPDDLALINRLCNNLGASRTIGFGSRL